MASLSRETEGVQVEISVQETHEQRIAIQFFDHVIAEPPVPRVRCGWRSADRKVGDIDEVSRLSSTTHAAVGLSCVRRRVPAKR